MTLPFSTTREVKHPLISSEGAAGIDFFVPWDFPEQAIAPGRDILIPSGIKANIPPGFALVTFNKSGRSREGFQVGACVVDSDYQGEIHLHVWNISDHMIWVRPGEKLVQMILLSTPYVTLSRVPEEDLFHSASVRGGGGFGSTGVK